ncbi:hypothetical protein K466DRAFT_482108 [Polyporus arcularius HHB13444]|uniref:SET domain-containing protein n=1 Tax=Polyporus arcularius HHB13444 TaxID=1314778 RepID=A0A5C3PQJ8_9APHY|nr:hypothetical protein K466DRAFT_482108 [Polyporus arcularius HHB13444]
MSVQFVAAPSTPAISTPPLHIRTDPYAGRKYHASTALPAGSDLLGDCTPYSYTIWKRFRNEVCADCWRYDRGRRSFLTRRDDEGFGGNHGSTAEEGRATRGATTAGAGLWFCDERCQERWIAREGLDAVDLLRQLEGARQKKPKAKPSVHASAELKEMTQEVADRAWDTVRERERSPKELRKWRNVQLDDYETDMARYVLLALLRCHREQLRSQRDCTRQCTCQASSLFCGSRENGQAGSARDGSPPGVRSDPRDSCEQGSEWRMFSSLQTNELPLLRACPEILEHHTRIYQLLRGRFGASTAANSASRPTTRSPLPPVHSPQGIELASPAEVDGRRSRSDGDRPDLGDVITVANVRRILGVDAGNSFGIWEVPLMEESECLGFAVYPVASLFNHHCSPNVRKERDGRRLRFLTTRCVAEGEELCISYGHVESMSWTERQTELLEGWYFKCRCSRCTAEEPEREGAERGCR